MIKLSMTRKMGKEVGAFGLPAGTTCIASIDKEGNILPVCKACYGKQGSYRYQNVKNRRLLNLKLTTQPQFVDEMVMSVQSNGCKYFRFFDSGDIYSKELANKIYSICKRTPKVKYWIASKTLGLKEYTSQLRKLQSLPNVSVRVSYGYLDMKPPKVYNAIVAPIGSKVSKKFYLCPATESHGSCGVCKKCWDKGGTICYRLHGQSAKKLSREYNVSKDN